MTPKILGKIQKHCKLAFFLMSHLNYSVYPAQASVRSHEVFFAKVDVVMFERVQVNYGVSHDLLTWNFQTYRQLFKKLNNLFSLCFVILFSFFFLLNYLFTSFSH